MRTPLTLAVLIAAGVLLAGCATSTGTVASSPSVSTTSTASGTPTPGATDDTATAADITGTTWTGTGNGKSLSFTFQSGGNVVVEVGGKASGSAATDSWTQEDTSVTVSLDNGATVYVGDLSGTTLSGQASGASGDWDFSVTQK